MNIQCPHCFEQVPISITAIRIGQSRRCPRGRSARENPKASLQHCYCKVTLLVPSNIGVPSCCKCFQQLPDAKS